MVGIKRMEIMKKVFKSMMLLAAAATAFAACNKEVDTQEPGKTGEMKIIQFSAPVNDAETKATLTTDDEATFSAAWENADEMAIEALSEAAEYLEDGIATWNGTFFNTNLPTIADEVAGDWTYNGYYPAKVNIPFGSARVQNGNAYNSAYDVMTGEVSYESALLGQDADGGHMVIPMERLTSMIYFHLTSTLDEPLTSATLTVEGGDIAAESVEINNGGLEAGSGESGSITITFAEGTAPSAQDFRLWFNTLPVNATSLTLTVTTATKTATLSNTSGANYEAGKLYKIVKDGLNWESALTKGEEWTYTFTSTVFNANGTEELNGKEWTLAGDGGYWGYDTNNGRGQQFGSGSSPYKSLTLTSGFGDSYGVSSIVVNTSCAKDSDVTVSISVGGKAFTCEGNETVSLTTTATDYTFTSPDNNLSAGNIVIAYTQTTSKAIYVKTITVNPDEREKQTLTFSGSSFNVELGQSFTAPTLTGAHTDVTYESSNTAVATVDASTGAVEIKGVGSVTITATAAASEQYQSASASYEITVTKGIISIAEVYEAASGDVVKTRGIVASINMKGYIITDGTNNLNVYTNAVPDVELGDDVTVSGTRSLYNSVPRLNAPELITKNASAQEIVRSTLITITNDNANEHTSSSFVSLTGSLTTSNGYYNVSIDGASIQGSLFSPSTSQVFTGGTLAELLGNRVTVTGYIVGSNNNYLYISVVDIVRTPYLSYTNPAVAGFAEDSQITIPVDANVSWTASKGTDTDNIIKSVAYDSEEVTVTFNANSGAEKTATVIITPISESGLSAITVTVTQSAYGSISEPTTATLTLSSSKKFGTTSGSTLDDDQGNTWTCTGASIQNTYNTSYSGQQFGTSKTDGVYSFTATVSNKTITGVSIKAAAGSDTPTYTIKVNGTTWKSGSLSTTSTVYSATGSASGEIEIILNQNSGKKAIYLGEIVVTYI